MLHYTVALDLGKWKHAVTIFNVQTNQPCQTMTIKVNQTGFAQLDTTLTMTNDSEKSYPPV